MENGKPALERYPEIFGLINLLEFESDNEEIFSEDTGWTNQNFTRKPMYDGTPGRRLLLRTKGSRVGMTIDYDVPIRNGEARFLMKKPMTAQDALYHLNRWGREFQRDRDYVLPS